MSQGKVKQSQIVIFVIIVIFLYFVWKNIWIVSNDVTLTRVSSWAFSLVWNTKWLRCQPIAEFYMWENLKKRNKWKVLKLSVYSAAAIVSGPTGLYLAFSFSSESTCLNHDSGQTTWNDVWMIFFSSNPLQISYLYMKSKHLCKNYK